MFSIESGEMVIAYLFAVKIANVAAKIPKPLFSVMLTRTQTLAAFLYKS